MTLIVKVGGGAEVDVDAVVKDLAALGRPLVLLHGANHLRDELGAALGRPTRVVESISGYSSTVTDDEAMDVFLAAYAGIRNKRLVESLRRAGVDAVGLSGLDGGLVQGVRNPGIRVMREGRKVLVRDNSGKPRSVNGRLLRTLLDGGYTPVVTAPIAGEDGSALNTENDEVLALLAAAVEATDVVSLMAAPGLLARREDPSSLVREVHPDELPTWEQRVEGRMRRKVRALRSLFAACEGRAMRVVLADGRVSRPVTRALAGEGTLIERRAQRGGSTPVIARERGSRTWLQRQAQVELDVYGKRGLTLVSGNGTRVWDDRGREYLDCIAGHGALNLGHRHPALVAALRDAIEGPWLTPGSYVVPSRTRLMERLVAALPKPLDRSFLSNSGTEAVEAALKIARLHTGRIGFIAAVRGFHGRTTGALSVTSEPRYREPFEPLLSPVCRIPYNQVECVAEVIDETVAAVILEPVQGEGGVHPGTPEYFRAVRDACDRAGALLIIDEVQTGFGRTGALFAFERLGVQPDMVCLAKSIAGGLPLGATVVRTGIDLPVGSHGSTFGGNPLACAVAEATLNVLEGGTLVADANRKGDVLAARVRMAALDVVREVRQVGLMIGIQLRTQVRPYLAALQERGVLALAAGSTVLRLLPPLVITDEELGRVTDTVVEVLAR